MGGLRLGVYLPARQEAQTASETCRHETPPVHVWSLAGAQVSSRATIRGLRVVSVEEAASETVGAAGSAGIPPRSSRSQER